MRETRGNAGDRQKSGSHRPENLDSTHGGNDVRETDEIFEVSDESVRVELQNDTLGSASGRVAWSQIFHIIETQICCMLYSGVFGHFGGLRRL